MGKVKTRKWARILPGWVWAIVIDGIDFVVPYIPIVGEALNVGVDVAQGFAAFVVYDDADMWLAATAAEGILPQGLDLFPSYTAMYAYRSSR